MHAQTTPLGFGSGNKLIKQLGKGLMFIYILSTFIAHSEYFPLELNSISLYGFLAFGLLNFIFNKQFNISNLHFIWYGVFFCFSLLWVGILQFYWPGSEWFSTIYQMFIVLALSLSFAQFIESRKDLRIICYAYMLGAVLLIIFLSASGLLEEEERLGKDIMGNANTFAAMYMTAAILSIWMALNGKNLFEKILFWIGIIIIYYGLLLSGGRKFILIPFLALYTMLLLRKDKQGRRHIVIYTFLVVALLSGLIWLMMNNDDLYKVVGYRMQYLFNMVEGTGEIGSSNELRQKLYNLAILQGFESPVWGHGFDAFKNLGRQELHFYAYSHNNWAELWYNHGLIGLLIYYWFFYKTIACFWRYRNTSQDIATFGIAIIVATFVFEIGAVSYFLYQTQILFSISSALFLICLQEKEAKYAQT